MKRIFLLTFILLAGTIALHAQADTVAVKPQKAPPKVVRKPIPPKSSQKKYTKRPPRVVVQKFDPPAKKKEED